MFLQKPNPTFPYLGQVSIPQPASFCGPLGAAEMARAGPLGAAFAVMKAVGGFVPKLWLAKILNWIGAKVRNFPKAVSHVDDLPAKWKHMGRTHGLRVDQAWE